MLFRSPPLLRTPIAPPGLALLATLALSATACTTETYETIDDANSTSVALILRPAEFIGDTPCSGAPGAMRSYVATVRDLTNPDVPFTLPSSLPTPCSMGVRFDEIDAGRSYSVQIDGYEGFADEIGPAGWFDGGAINYKALRSGTRHMEDKGGTPLLPRWLGSCGEGDEAPTVAAEIGTTLIRGCTSLVDTAPGTTETAVEVAPQDALGTLHCAGKVPTGELAVASFDLLPQNGLASVLGVPCLDAPFVQPYTGASLVPGTAVDFFVDAHAEQGGPVVWGATCSALVQAGLTVRASCSPLSDRGALRIDITAVLGLLGISCSGDIAAYDAALVAGDVSLGQAGVPCTDDVTFGSLPPGDAAAEVTIFTKAGAPIFSLACAAAVEPGRTANADCTLQ